MSKSDANASRPERLIYLLDCDEKRQLRCEFRLTRLLKWEKFQPAPIRAIRDLFQKRFSDYLRPEDRRILMRLQYWEGSEEPVAILHGPEAYQLLREMVELGRAFLIHGNHLRLKWGDVREASPRWRSHEGRWQPDFEIDPTASALLATEPPCYLDDDDNVAGPVSSAFSPALAASWTKTLPMTDDEARPFCLRLMNRFPGETVPLPGEKGSHALEEIEPQVCLRVFRRDTGEALASNRAYALKDIGLVQLHFAYGPRKVEWNSDAETIAFEEKGSVRRCPRARDIEEKALATFRGLGFVEAGGPESDGLFNFHAADFQLDANAPITWEDLFKKEFPRLRREHKWKIVFDPSLNLVGAEKTKWFSNITPSSTGDWFSFEAGIEYNGTRIPILDIIRSLLREHSESSQEELVDYCRRSSFTVPIDNGEKLLVVPGERIADLVKTLFELRFAGGQNGTLEISAWRAADLVSDGIADMETNSLIRRLQRLRQDAREGLDLTGLADLPELPITPRDYQREGLAWLDFLREYEFNGILADDMGLGKTMQVLIHLLREKEEGRLDGPCLIVAPTSVLDTWEGERERFTPGLRLLRFHGADRERPTDGFEAFDIVLTSYALARLDAESLRETEWHLVVLDEAQRIKNPDSSTARSLCSLPSRRRLCLTGTPMENHLGELWSLFQFLMPGFLGDRRSFNEYFRKPVEADKEEFARETAHLLSQRIRPFILRRKKDQVARELPPRTEIIRKVRLAPKQAELYESVRLRLHTHIASELEKRGVGGSQITILDGLLKLRQICCDPRLHRNLPNPMDASDSAKLDALLDMLENLIEEGRRVLVFSQFVSVLDLVAAELEERRWDFLTLTGETADRGKVVDSFQNGNAPIFLISLKAGGSGLTLTAADTVIQFDPWWNPAVEQQAADRVYRIGQDKPVFVYRLIAEGTVEEKILSLQNRKQGIIDNILAGVPSGSNLIDKDTVDALFGQTPGHPEPSVAQ